MRIALFGATGNVGRRILTEAVSRGHDVTAIIRDASRLESLPAGTNTCIGDAGNSEDVARLGADQDIVIGATRPSPGREPELVLAARSLLTGTAIAGTRLLLVGGAASLIVPGTGGRKVVDDPAYVSPAWRAIALACVDQLGVCRADVTADWTYLSPPALLEPGRRSGKYRVGKDELLVNDEGDSFISMEDFAVAMLDEAEQPNHRRTRFTVGY